MRLNPEALWGTKEHAPDARSKEPVRAARIEENLNPKPPSPQAPQPLSPPGPLDPQAPQALHISPAPQPSEPPRSRGPLLLT